MNRNDLILEITKKVLEINSRYKNTIFFEFYGHVNLLRIEIDKSGWASKIEPDFRKEIFMDILNEKEVIEQLNVVFEYLKNLEDK